MGANKWEPSITLHKTIYSESHNSSALQNTSAGYRAYWCVVNTHAIMRVCSSVFRMYYAIHDGPVTSTCVSHCHSCFGSIIVWQFESGSRVATSLQRQILCRLWVKTVFWKSNMLRDASCSSIQFDWVTLNWYVI